MVKITKTKTFDTETATVVESVVCGVFGEPEGYEMKMYISPEGNYFLYVNGGKKSPYKTERLIGYTKARATDWLNKH